MVGRPGRQIVKKYLEDNRQNYDFVIANVENASHGFGLTEKNHNELIGYGIDCMTSGNHIWDKKDIYGFIDSSNALIRPLNYPIGVQGVGYRIFKDNIVVVNLLGRVFMNPMDCPFRRFEELIKQIGNKKIIIVDFHGEATAEKICFTNFALELGANAVIGTHTHVQTADEKIIKGTCAHITDVGFCGAFESVIGMEYEGSIKQMLTSIPHRFEVVEKPQSVQLNACEITFNLENNKPIDIKRIYEVKEVQYEN